MGFVDPNYFSIVAIAENPTCTPFGHRPGQQKCTDYIAGMLLIIFKNILNKSENATPELFAIYIQN